MKQAKLGLFWLVILAACGGSGGAACKVPEAKSVGKGTQEVIEVIDAACELSFVQDSSDVLRYVCEGVEAATGDKKKFSVMIPKRHVEQASCPSK